MRPATALLAACSILLAGRAATAADAFDRLHCGTDVAKALIGRRSSNARVTDLEKKHQDIALKNLGGDEASDTLFTGSWKICGEEFLLLEEKDVIRDVLAFPAHSSRTPQSMGPCEGKGIAPSEAVVALLTDDGGKDALPATAAWKIDRKKRKFEKIPTDGLRCSRSGIVSDDQPH